MPTEASRSASLSQLSRRGSQSSHSSQRNIAGGQLSQSLLSQSSVDDQDVVDELKLKPIRQPSIAVDGQSASTPRRKAGKLRRCSTQFFELSKQRSIDAANFKREPSSSSKKISDPFIERILLDELVDTLHAFDLNLYGRPLAKLIISQMQKEKVEAQLSSYAI